MYCCSRRGGETSPIQNCATKTVFHQTTEQAFVSHHVDITEEKYLQVVRSVATCRYKRDPTSHLVESLMVSRKTLQCRMEPRRTHKDTTVVTSVESNIEDGTRIIGGQLGTRDGSAPCTQHGEPVGTQRKEGPWRKRHPRRSLCTNTWTTKTRNSYTNSLYYTGKIESTTLTNGTIKFSI